MTHIDRVNAIHGDAFRRAGGDREVALSILAQRVTELEAALRQIESYRGEPSASHAWDSEMRNIARAALAGDGGGA